MWGNLAGNPVKTLATYQAEMRSDGSWIGECPNSGIVLAADGGRRSGLMVWVSPKLKADLVFAGLSILRLHRRR